MDGYNVKSDVVARRYTLNKVCSDGFSKYTK